MWTCSIYGLTVTPHLMSRCDITYVPMSPWYQQRGLAVIWEGAGVIEGSLGSLAPITGCRFFSSDVIFSCEAVAMTYKYHFQESE